jgi:predicted permease
MKRFFLRILNAVFPGRADDELAREVASHLAMLEGEGVRRGMTREEARLAARRAFGGVEHTKDLHRDVRSFVRLDDLRRDVQYGARTLRHTPGFTAIAVLTLALGIGANTAIFSVVNGVLLRPLPYKDPQRLVRIVENISAGDTSIGPRRRAVGLNLAELVTFRSKATTLSHAGVYVESTMTLAGRDESIRLTAIRLSPAFFSMLGVSPLRGRTFESREETPGADGVVVLSYSTWQRYFGGAPDVLSRSLTLDGRSFAVVGVMPSDFQFPDPQTQLWIPYALSGAGARLPIIARIADGATVEAASAEVGAILRQLLARSSRQPSDQGPFELEHVQDQLVAPVKPALRMLTAAVGFVLLIACINVANLMLARTAARQREIAVRLALGASRGRLIRQLLTESTMLALLGGAAGTGLAFGGLRLLQALGAGLPRGDLTLGVSIPRLDEIGIDLRVLAFTLAIALLTGVLFGLAPAARHSRSGQTDTLREGSASSAGSGFNLLRGHRLQGLLIVAEIAMAMLLLVGGGLMIRSFVNLSNVDPGYNPAGLLTFQVFSPRARPTFRRRSPRGPSLVATRPCGRLRRNASHASLQKRRPPQDDARLPDAAATSTRPWGAASTGEPRHAHRQPRVLERDGDARNRRTRVW